ncbi:MAG: transglutaminase-like domain-containing protein [Thermodesulfobacteriota bacterium]
MKLSMKKIRGHHIAGLLCMVTFAVLLSIRGGLFAQKPQRVTGEALSAAERMAGKSHWMNIYQNGSRIGYARRSVTKLQQGGFAASELVYMRLMAMGLVQEVHFTTTGILRPDLTLDKFTFELASHLFSFRARGEMTDDRTMALYVGEPGKEERVDIPLKQRPYLGASLVETAAAQGLAVGQSRTFPVFDPATTGEKPVKLTVVSEETIPVMGEQVKALKVAVNFMGSDQYAWIGPDGEVLAEEGPLGIRMEKASIEQVFSGDYSSGETDMAQATSIDPGAVIAHPDKLKKLVIAVSGPGPEYLANLSGGRQEYADGLLTVTREDLPAAEVPGTEQNLPADIAPFAAPSTFIESDNPEIAKTAAEIASSSDPLVVRARKIVAWVYENLEKRPVFSVPDAVQTLKNRSGDCNEHSVLTAALARAAGIPAQMEVGVVYLKGKFFYHAWNSFYLDGRWVTADSAFGQFPADVTHLRFARGDARSQIDMMGVIGKLSLSIKDQETTGAVAKSEE